MKCKTVRIALAAMPMLAWGWGAAAETTEPSVSGLSRPKLCTGFEIPAGATKLDDRVYRISIAGKPAGRELMSIWRSGGKTIVTSEVDLKVRLYWVHLEIFRNCRKETWENFGRNKLILNEFQSETNKDDGSENKKIHLIWNQPKRFFEYKFSELEKFSDNYEPRLRRDFTTLSIFGYDLESKTKYIEPVKFDPENMDESIREINVEFVRKDKFKSFELSLFKITGEIRRYVWYDTNTNKMVRMCGREILDTDIEGSEDRIAPILKLMPKCQDMKY